MNMANPTCQQWRFVYRMKLLTSWRLIWGLLKADRDGLLCIFASSPDQRCSHSSLLSSYYIASLPVSLLSLSDSLLKNVSSFSQFPSSASRALLFLDVGFSGPTFVFFSCSIFSVIVLSLLFTKLLHNGTGVSAAGVGVSLSLSHSLTLSRTLVLATAHGLH